MANHHTMDRQGLSTPSLLQADEMKIGSNISSLKAQRALGESTAALTKSYERLTSGQRINSGADDAAGLSIAETINAKSRVYTQGVRNLNDAISFLNIAQGSVQQLKTVLLRQRELATQSANGVYSNTQRQAMEKESAALGSEYNRIVEGTKFNGKEIFNSPDGVIAFQGGFGTEGVYQIGLTVGASTGSGNTVYMPLNTTLVSTNSSGAISSGSSQYAAISSDGRYLAFQSVATNLVSGDTNGFQDVFVKDLVTGNTTRVSTDSSGNQANNGSVYNLNISPDGHFVVFESWASNLAVGDTNATTDIFIKDLISGATRMVSTDSSGNQGTDTSETPLLSPDGRYVLFKSMATNLVSGDTNGAIDIFMKDLVTGTTTRVSTTSSGVQGTGNSRAPTLSADGRFLAFYSDSTNLVAGDTNGQADVFVKNLQTGAITRASTNSSGAQATNFSFSPVLSADGRYVAFSSHATNLVAGDTNARFDSFLKDLVTGTITRISTDSSGNQATNSSDPSAVSSDGRFVAFASAATNLVPGDTNGQSDAFIKDLVTGTTVRISTNASGSQATGGASLLPIFSGDSRYVTFYSNATNLMAGDTNGAYDVFLVGNPLFSEVTPATPTSSTESLTLTPISDISLATRTSALSAQDRIDSYMEQLQSVEGLIGCYMSRMEVGIANLSTMADNLQAARSRIMDVDIAQESANLVRTQILQQAAAAVLAQANQQPSLALRLLTN